VVAARAGQPAAAVGVGIARARRILSDSSVTLPLFLARLVAYWQRQPSKCTITPEPRLKFSPKIKLQTSSQACRQLSARAACLGECSRREYRARLFPLPVMLISRDPG
jgi:hypothetical protein